MSKPKLTIIQMYHSKQTKKVTYLVKYSNVIDISRPKTFFEELNLHSKKVADLIKYS